MGESLTIAELKRLHDAILTHPDLETAAGDDLDRIGDKIMTMVLEAEEA